MEKVQINTIRDEKEGTTIGTNEIQTFMMTGLKNLFLVGHGGSCL